MRARETKGTGERMKPRRTHGAAGALIAAAAVAMAVVSIIPTAASAGRVAAGLSVADGEHAGADLDRQGRGQAQPDRLGGLRPAPVGQAVRAADRLPGERQVRRHLQRHGLADGERRRRPVRPRVGLRRRRPASDLRRRRAAGEHLPGPVLEALPPVPAVAGVQHDRRQALRRLIRVRPERAAVLDQDVQDRADVVVGDLQRQVQGPDHGARQPDPDRRRRAVPVEDASPSSASPTPTS